MNHTTTRPGIFNVAGKQILEPRDMSHTGKVKSFGLPLDEKKKMQVTQNVSRSGPLNYATQTL